jgi:hypothetical protein
MSGFLRAQIRASLLVAALVVSAATASAQSAQQVVEDLNRGAMEAYNAMDINKAGSMLEEALRVSAQGVTPQVLALTNLNLGVVYIGGLSDIDNGTKYFIDALCADPSVQLDPLTSTPDIQAAFSSAQQRAQAGGCPSKGAGGGGGGPGPVAVPTEVVTHFSPPEQTTQTPLPLYVEVNRAARARAVNLYYKGTGMEQWKKVSMLRYQQGYAYQISCSDVFEPQVQYYIEAVGSTGNVVGGAGTAGEPITVPVVATLTQGAPALPGAEPPVSCAAAECPPGVSGCAGGTGTAGIDEACSSTSDCQSGLSCDSDVCVLRGAGGSSEGEASGGIDEELPPGWGDEAEEGADAKDFKRGFFQLGLAMGMTYVSTSNMIADRPPPRDRIFIDNASGQFVPITEMDDGAGGSVLSYPVPDTQLVFPGTEIGMVNPATGVDIGIERETAWIPDSDSNDAVGPFNGACDADGTETGPNLNTNTFDNLLPSRYCVRVKSPGFVTGFALRSAIGYFVSERISLALLMRLQFSAGEGTFSNMLLGARAEYMFSDPKPKGFFASMYLGGTFGQIQAKPPATGNTDEAPFIKSGLQGGHLGANLRYRVHKNFGFYVAPELDMQFPTFLWNIDLTLAGLEAAF